MKNLQNLKELEELLINLIKLGEIDEFNLYDSYQESEPLTYLGQDVIDLEKSEILGILDRAIWAINGIYNSFEKLQKLDEDAINLKNAKIILHEKMTAYQEPFAEKGRKFKSGKPKGAISDTTKYIQDLVKQNPMLSAKELKKIADKNLVDDMPVGTFANKVSDAKKLLK